MQSISRSLLKSSLILLCISIGAMFFRLGDLPFTGSDEPRYARVAQEMHEAGEWVTPTLEGHAWLEKPPLYYWITMVAYDAFGVTETAARLAAAGSALLAGFVLLWMGRQVISPLAGLLGGAIFLTSFGIAGYARNATTDMLFTSCLTIAMALLGARVLRPQTSVWAVWFGYVFLGLSILSKGPAGPVLLGGVFLLFWWWDSAGGSLRRIHVVAGCLITAAIALPWFWLAYLAHGLDFVLVFILNHNLVRFVTDIHHHVEPFYFYLPVLVGLFFPWSGWGIALFPSNPLRVLRSWRHWSADSTFFVIWLVVPFLFFSLSQSKLPGYVLPCIAPLALLLGKRMAAAPLGNKEKSSATWVYLALTITFAVVLPIVFYRDYEGAWRGAAIVGLVCLVPAVIAALHFHGGKRAAAARYTAIQGVLIVVAMTQFLFPALAEYHSTQGVARRALLVRSQDEPIVTYQFFHHTLNYYTGYQVEENLINPEGLMQFAEEHPQFLIVTETRRTAHLTSLVGFRFTLLMEQGPFRLFRLVSE